MRAGDMGIHMPLNPGDFVPNPSDPRALTGNLADNNLSIGNDIKDVSGSYIYGGDSDIAYCVAGKCIFGIGVRVYFEFTFQDTDTSSDSTAQADGFTFTVFNGSNNTKNSTGGAPAGISMGELIGYAGPGRTNGLGLQPPKMAIEFDTFPNTGSTDICAANSRNDADNNNHMALMFWGDDLTGNCTISGTDYPKTTFDDNKHGAGTGDNPVNSSKGDGLGGYYAGAKNGSYNWLEDAQLHSFRMEITRATTPVSGKYAYNIKAWVDCPGCTADQLKTFKDLTVPYDNESLSPKRINRTISLAAADHQAFNTMLFGWTFATGGSTQRTSIQNFDLYFPRSSCGYATDPVSASPNSAAQSGNINVLATAGCTWTAVSDSLWLTIPSGGGNGTGTGNGTVTYNVSANTGAARTGIITIGDYVFKVTQDSGCTYTVASVTTSYTAGGGNDTYSVTTGSGCPWTTSNGGNTWITVTPASATGSGSGTVTVQANTGIARTGTITIAGQTFTVNQANGCTYSITPASASPSASGGSSNVTVTSGTGCPWTAVSNNAWITVTSGASGTGNGTVAYNVSANTGLARTGTITIAGQTFTINQSNGCSYTFSACPAAFPRAGGTGSVSVTTAAGCTWTSSDNVLWISTSPASSSGSGSVTITVSAGTGGNTPRSGTVTVSGTMGNTTSTSCTITENH
jgi:hypothetical protein